MNLRFYRCSICGKIVTVLSDTSVPTVCCGQTMKEIIPNRTDADLEKHVPVFSVADRVVSVQVGSDMHPMTENHRITWIGLRTNLGFQFIDLRPEDEAKVSFLLSPEEKVEEVYAYCNLHGLWCSEKGIE